jgi:hypothetical protein
VDIGVVPWYPKSRRYCVNPVRCRAMPPCWSLHTGFVPGDIPTNFVDREIDCVPRRVRY